MLFGLRTLQRPDRAAELKPNVRRICGSGAGDYGCGDPDPIGCYPDSTTSA
jgi:hypothetical protein